MMKNKDQEIKVFGWTINIGLKSDKEETVIGSKMEASASTGVSCECTSFDENLLSSNQMKNRENEGCSRVEDMDMNQEDESSTSSSLEECKTPSSIVTQSHKTLSANQNSTTRDLVQTPADTESDTLKKPEEIRPCPRCNSMNTKFCYFNNYNVNQPRHFCKNCQRYWTAGGCMRNVAVGSGRRKSKASQPESPTVPNYWPMRPNPVENQGIDTSQSQPSSWATYGWSPIPWQSGYPHWVCHFVPNPNPNPNSHPFLGKHSRNEAPIKEKNSIPKTLRIVEDPIEVSRSSVLGDLEVEKAKARSSNTGGGFFQGFERKGIDASHTSGEGSHLAIHANPAASNRSLSFHEVREQGCK